MEIPAVAIVILNYNGKKFLEQFLPAVLASTYKNCRVVVADNASTDDSLNFLNNHYPDIQQIKLEENFGYAGGYNRALQHLDEPYFILLNSDIEVTPGWIEPIIEMMEADKTIAACQPKLRSYTQRSYFEYAGACGGWMDTLGYPFARGRIMETCEEDHGQYDDTQEVFWASGAALFFRREIFLQMKGFNEQFFAHMEEIELCWRLHLYGYRVMCCPASVVYHVGGGTLPKGNSRKVYLNFRNNLWMLSLHLPPREKIWKMPLRFLLDMAFALKCLLSGHFDDMKAVFQAWWTIIFRPLSWGDKAPRTTLKKLPGIYSGVLLWAYYIQGKKYFTKIWKKNL